MGVMREDNSQLMLLNLTMNFLETRKDRVFDLLEGNQHERVALKVSNHPILGVYVPELKEVVISSYADFCSVLEAGLRLRSPPGLAGRHHVLTLTLTQVDPSAATDVAEITSRLVFFDLGSVDTEDSSQPHSPGLVRSPSLGSASPRAFPSTFDLSTPSSPRLPSPTPALAATSFNLASPAISMSSSSAITASPRLTASARLASQAPPPLTVGGPPSLNLSSIAPLSPAVPFSPAVPLSPAVDGRHHRILSDGYQLPKFSADLRTLMEDLNASQNPEQPTLRNKSQAIISMLHEVWSGNFDSVVITQVSPTDPASIPAMQLMCPISSYTTQPQPNLNQWTSALATLHQEISDLQIAIEQRQAQLLAGTYIDSRLCVNCEESNVDFYCRNCQKYLCSDCCGGFHRPAKMKSHELVGKNDLARDQTRLDEKQILSNQVMIEKIRVILDSVA
eukprot:TRINITY_DN1721_c0_g2_i6.p1 TRINITY_DN1721_c0_g2~~TRINITY_DN1721_c0_g2_i6.p1  ORF type:complete len:449 (+),score=102.11 TRINITY_DN1721_c0_g2_i6:45-1391(+)